MSLPLALRIKLATDIAALDGYRVVSHVALTTEDWPHGVPVCDLRYAPKAARSVLWVRHENKLIPYPLPMEKVS